MACALFVGAGKYANEEDGMKMNFPGRITVFLVSLLFLFSSALAAEESGARGRSFLWKVQARTGVAYLLGSVHLAKPDLYPLPRQMEESFARAGVLALEADPAKASDPVMQLQMLTAARYQGGETLKQHLAKATYDLAVRELARLGLPTESFGNTRPWFLAVTIEAMELQRLGYDPAYGLDLHFAEKARGRKRLVELESFDYQFRLMNGFSEREEELFLLYTLRELASLRDEVDELMRAWRTGDARTVETIMTRTLTDFPEAGPLFAKLFTQRNREMAGKIEKLLQGGETVFVVVGAAHLVGREGIVELLRGKGCKVEQL
jgi:uncharacterized protein